MPLELGFDTILSPGLVSQIKWKAPGKPSKGALQIQKESQHIVLPLLKLGLRTGLLAYQSLCEKSESGRAGGHPPNTWAPCSQVENVAELVRSASSQSAGQVPKVLPPSLHSVLCCHVGEQLLPPEKWVPQFTRGSQTFLPLALLHFPTGEQWEQSLHWSTGSAAPFQHFLRAFLKCTGDEGCPDYSDSRTKFCFPLWKTYTDVRVRRLNRTFCLYRKKCYRQGRTKSFAMY